MTYTFDSIENEHDYMLKGAQFVLLIAVCLHASSATTYLHGGRNKVHFTTQSCSNSLKLDMALFSFFLSDRKSTLFVGDNGKHREMFIYQRGVI